LGETGVSKKSYYNWLERDPIFAARIREIEKAWQEERMSEAMSDPRVKRLMWRKTMLETYAKSGGSCKNQPELSFRDIKVLLGK
jgi:hypothetical protein